MAIEVRAQYVNGKLIPLAPIDLEEGCTVQISIKKKKSLSEIVEELHQQIPEEEWENSPTDGSVNYRHYLYGHHKGDE